MAIPSSNSSGSPKSTQLHDKIVAQLTRLNGARDIKLGMHIHQLTFSQLLVKNFCGRHLPCQHQALPCHDVLNLGNSNLDHKMQPLPKYTRTRIWLKISARSSRLFAYMKLSS
jgi:hypothetical protein